jgi:regulator of ribonuclease activity A
MPDAGAWTTADLVDRYGPEVASVPLQLRSFGRHRSFTGPAVTVRCLEDNALLKRVLAETPDARGHVLVVDGGGSLRSALVGDLIAGIAVDRGWVGLVLHGVVRDSVALDQLPLGIKALGTNPAKSGKTGAGEVDVPVEIGGVQITPGCTVWSDPDGVLVGSPPPAG